MSDVKRMKYDNCDTCDDSIIETGPWFGRNKWGLGMCRICTTSGLTEGLSLEQESRLRAFFDAKGISMPFQERNAKGFLLLPRNVVRFDE